MCAPRTQPYRRECDEVPRVRVRVPQLHLHCDAASRRFSVVLRRFDMQADARPMFSFRSARARRVTMTRAASCPRAAAGERSGRRHALTTARSLYPSNSSDVRLERLRAASAWERGKAAPEARSSLSSTAASSFGFCGSEKPRIRIS